MPPADPNVVESLPRLTLPLDELKARAEKNKVPPDCAGMHDFANLEESRIEAFFFQKNIVCMSSIEDNEKVIEMPCHHLFHEECLLPWLKTRNTCPVCRHQLAPQDRFSSFNQSNPSAPPQNTSAPNPQFSDEGSPLPSDGEGGDEENVVSFSIETSDGGGDVQQNECIIS